MAAQFKKTIADPYLFLIQYLPENIYKPEFGKVAGWGRLFLYIPDASNHPVQFL